jgi:thioredoxin-like negative regulator of GroEL
LQSGSPIYLLLWPEVIQLCFDASDAATAHGDRPWAAHVLGQLLAEDPGALPVALRLSEVYVEMGLFGEARTVLEAAAVRAPNNMQIRAALEALRRHSN